MPVPFVGTVIYYGGIIWLSTFIVEKLTNYFPEGETCSDQWTKFNYSGLASAMKEQLYGQPLVKDTVLRLVEAHVINPNPRKALVMSFHGWTGSGKNYVSRMVAENLFKRGTESDFVHTFISTLHFPHKSQVALYQDQVRQWVRGNVSRCARSLFIFDEMDKMHPEVISAIKPFIDSYPDVDNVNHRKAIFIFLSNVGAKEINKFVFTAWRSGQKREDISLKELEDVVTRSAYNTEGGLFRSEVISQSLITAVVPFLPLDRSHVVACIEWNLRQRGYKSPNQSLVTRVADQLSYMPRDTPVFSTTGCKRVDDKVQLELV